MEVEHNFEEELFERVIEIVEGARSHVTRTVNAAMVHAYWFIGREIVEHEQGGEERAEYGEQLIKNLSTRLMQHFGKGFSSSNLRRMRQFYLAYPNGTMIPEDLRGNPKRAAVPRKSTEIIDIKELESTSTTQSYLFPPDLGWTHYKILTKVKNHEARAFYEIEAIKENWSTRELERQIASLLYERLAKSRDKEQVLALSKEGQQITHPGDVLKDPMILEFLGLEEREHWQERDLEQAIIDHLEGFLLELGKGFCFVARQKRMTMEGDHFYADLVFYNRLLQCFVLLDLKLGKLTHQDIGQMQMYVNYYDRYQRQEWEGPTVGVILCSEKNETMVRITLPEDNQQILASQYQVYLPTEEELKEAVTVQRNRLEQTIRLSQDEPEE